nr:hypothetical protein [Catenulispora rubra]
MLVGQLRHRLPHRLRLDQLLDRVGRGGEDLLQLHAADLGRPRAPGPGRVDRDPAQHGEQPRPEGPVLDAARDLPGVAPGPQPGLLDQVLSQRDVAAGDAHGVLVQRGGVFGDQGGQGGLDGRVLDGDVLDGGGRHHGVPSEVSVLCASMLRRRGAGNIRQIAEKHPPPVGRVRAIRRRMAG